jgi:hypothetical protein
MSNPDPTKHSDYTLFEEMWRNGATPVEACRAAAGRGFDNIAQIKMVRAVFGIGLAQAKEVKLVADGVNPDEHWDSVAEALEQAQLEDLLDSDRCRETD